MCASNSNTDLLSTQAYTVYTRLRVNTDTSQTRKKKIQLGLEKSTCSSVAHHLPAAGTNIMPSIATPTLAENRASSAVLILHIFQLWPPFHHLGPQLQMGGGSDQAHGMRGCLPGGHRWHCCSHSGHVAIVMITAVVGEALPAIDAALFPAEGAAGLASNLQTWLREPQLKSQRHCSPGATI